MWVDKKYLGAFKMGHRKNARWCIDNDFSFELLKKANEGCKKSQEALEYLTKFNNEYHKGVVKKGDTFAFHSSDQLRKECYNRVNAINSDTASVCVWDDETDSRCVAVKSYDPTEDIINIIDALSKFPDPINE